MSKSKRLNRDHAKETQRPMVEDRVVAEHLTALLTPTIKSQSRFFRELGLRDRILTLPLIVATQNVRPNLDYRIYTTYIRQIY